MTGYEAIAKAAREGGEVWYAGADHKSDFRAAFGSNGKMTNRSIADISTSGDVFYTVRPLPPGDMSFDEAWECLKRGEKVKIVDDIYSESDPRSILRPNISSTRCAKEGDGYWARCISDLKDKRFRKA